MAYSLSRLIVALFLVLVMPSPSAWADQWDDKESVIAKEIYVPEIKLVRPDDIPAAMSQALVNAGVDVLYVDKQVNPGKYSCTPLSVSERNSAIAAVLMALKKIPASAFKNIGMKYVMLCDEAFAQGQSIGGIPVPPLKLLMLSMGSTGQEYQEHIFYHELYHYMEFTKRGGFHDADWQQKFSDGYGMNNSDWNIGSGDYGFVSGYAQTKPEEDRAEIFAHMMADPAAAKNKAEKDNIVQQKMEYIRDVAERQFGIKVMN